MDKKFFTDLIESKSEASVEKINCGHSHIQAILIQNFEIGNLRRQNK